MLWVAFYFSLVKFSFCEEKIGALNYMVKGFFWEKNSKNLPDF
jgi:hypothetical protein